jgi:hypothetical protein
MLGVQATDDALVCALQDLGDLAVGPAAMILADDARAGAIAVQHLPHFRGGKVHAQRPVVGGEESVAVGMRVDAPFDASRRDDVRRAQRRRVRRSSRGEFTLGFRWFFL